MSNNRRNMRNENDYGRDDLKRKIEGYRKNTENKENLIMEAKRIEEFCTYDDSYDTEQCRRQMQQLQHQWKNIGSAGKEENRLWEHFSTIQDRFWNHIKLMDLENKIADLEFRQSELYGDYEDAKYLRKWGRVESLSNKIDDLDYRIRDLQDKADKIKEILY